MSENQLAEPFTVFLNKVDWLIDWLSSRLCVSHVQFFGLICTARYVLSSLKISYGETKFEIFREQVGHLHLKLLDEVEQNIVICQWRADKLFAEAKGLGK